MGLFGSYERQPATTDVPEDQPQPEEVDLVRRKNTRTPTRKEAQAARMAAIHPKLTPKEQRARDRAAEARRQNQQIAAMDERPERVMMRNYIDSRWSFAEFMWPILLIILALALLGAKVPWLVYGTTYALWAAMLVCILNIIFMWNGFKQELFIRHPGSSTKGLLWSMIQRMIMLRRFRNPGPAVVRGGAY